MHWHNSVEVALKWPGLSLWCDHLLRSDKASMPRRLVLMMMMMIIIINITSTIISFMSVDQEQNFDKQKSSDVLSSEFWIHPTYLNFSSIFLWTRVVISFSHLINHFKGFCFVLSHRQLLFYFGRTVTLAGPSGWKAGKSLSLNNNTVEPENIMCFNAVLLFSSLKHTRTLWNRNKENAWQRCILS